MTDLVTARATRRLLAAVTLLCAVGVGAQQPEALPRFQIELVVFENLGQPATAEAPPFEWLEPPLVQIPGTPETGALDALNPAGTLAEPEQSATIFFSLSPALSMANIAASLQRRSEYRVLLHEAWIQDGFEGEAARAVDVGLLEQLQPVTRSSRRARSSSGEPLAGTVTFFRGRYLHLDMSLNLGDGAGRELRERRRVRIGERHYFDAPQIGVIAAVTRIESADSSEVAGAGD